jgi:hypothetical protein
MTTVVAATATAGTRLMPLQSLAVVIRSKNAGPFQYTVDVLFRDEDSYEAAKSSNVVTRERVAELYKIGVDRVTGVYFWDSALALKITLLRDHAAGSPGDNDCYGAQQHVPLLAITIPVAGPTDIAA